ncbi:hypothetical protein QQ008_09645 [Fulvivirgaceae bacterium BMA10]|uniref:Uncharacterized protein n=1 Tax=Splendidivirga corallicola TaxID=3051826 RepID=A0ABT8KLM7_9BACT|nr:hypothetical protein [Fulvivirgaceae bacterium BMA10]
MKLLTGVICLFLLLSVESQAQFKKKVKKKKQKSAVSVAPSSRENAGSTATYASSRKKPSKGNFRTQLEAKQVEYDQRMKANAKKYKKMAKEMKKPQYSDPSYFGHKKKPKKRPPGKKKFCKECEIVH